MAEWVRELPAAIAPEHIRHRLVSFCTGGHSAGERVVRIFNIEIETHGRASKALRPVTSHLRMFLTQYDDRIPDLDFRVHDALLIWSEKAHELLRPECTCVKPDGLLNIPQGERQGHGMEAGRKRNGLH